ncbi:hypothetical protein [Bacteroides caecimuris]|uniref:hypothetical protein n=1 Tax=Bacteroides caecimuris TaxID=1796613 RepID=UPI0026EF7435|nr:hypothetical protein [Bacteroides caecimuris]
MGEIVDGGELLLIRVYVSAVEAANFNFFSNEKNSRRMKLPVSQGVASNIRKDAVWY